MKTIATLLVACALTTAAAVTVSLTPDNLASAAVTTDYYTQYDIEDVVETMEDISLHYGQTDLVEGTTYEIDGSEEAEMGNIWFIPPATNQVANTGFHVEFANGTSALLSFRMKYNANLKYRFRFGDTNTSQWVTTSKGYFADLNPSATKLTVRGWCTKDDAADTAGGASSDALYNAASNVNLSETLTDGDDLIVTLGVYTNANSKNQVVLKLEKYANGTTTTVLNCDIEDQYTSYNTMIAGTGTVKHGVVLNGATDTAGSLENVLGGVKRPIIASEYDTSAKDGEYYANDSASLALPEGYTLQEESKTLVAGENKIPVYYAMTYYGSSIKVPCTMTATASAYRITNIEDLATSIDSDGALSVGELALKTGVNALVAGETYTTDGTTLGSTTFSSATKGNIYLKGIQNTGFILPIEKETLLRFRMKYDSDQIYTFMFSNDAYTNGIAVAASSGYFAQFRPTFLQVRSKTANGSTADTAGGGTADGLYTVKTLNNDFTAYDGKDLIITFGSYPTSEGKNQVVLRVECEENNTVTLVKEINQVDTYSDIYKVGNDTNYMGMYWNGGTSGVVYENEIGGVNRPLIANEYDTSAKDGEYYANDSASLALPEGYTLQNENATLEAGENKISVYYPMTYYGSSIKVPCFMMVTAKSPYTVTLQKADGTQIQTQSFNGESSYLLPEKINENVTFIGWLTEDNKLYPAGYTYAVTESVVLTLAEAAFSLDDGAAVRVSNANSGYGGMRFTAQLQSATVSEILAHGKWIGAILPTDSLGDDGLFTEADLTTVTETNSGKEIGEDNRESVIGGVDGYFALTSILVTNYNREFSAMSYLTITYDDDAKTTKSLYTAYDEAKNSRSVVQIAYMAKNDTDTDYTDAQDKILDDYIQSVVIIDANGAVPTTITFTVQSEEYTVATNNAYQVSGYTAESGFTLTTGKAYTTSADGKIHIPVILVRDGVWTRKQTTATLTAAEDGTNTYTVEWYTQS